MHSKIDIDNWAGDIMKKLLYNQSGLTLIELLAAITILAIVIATFLGLFTNAFRFNHINADHLQAMNLAREYQAVLKENPDKNEAFTQFIRNINNDSHTEDFSMANPDYQALQLSENILPPDQVALGDYYLLTIDHQTFQILIYMKEEPDVENVTSGAIDGMGIYRLYIQVFEDSKMLSDTYTYFQYD
ncbi:prepilin-type N-terminal cleavage/methylation domain-containing protein [Aquibacillus albus]|uniref:Prepilin-type N-terminal cleavage/methylation domain-containing protein n=1 Tax=Aquibacillus albus TaxID=1168171 RepID=A0ABS2MXS6_9BACI|nr:prepilin-type N-terminal cleavage/methylation domain-containing protein [Aquibacillus albus]